MNYFSCQHEAGGVKTRRSSNILAQLIKMLDIESGLWIIDLSICFSKGRSFVSAEMPHASRGLLYAKPLNYRSSAPGILDVASVFPSQTCQYSLL